MADPNAAQRQEFEKVAPKGLPPFWDDELGRYVSIHTQWTFEVWQAARREERKRTLEECAEIAKERIECVVMLCEQCTTAEAIKNAILRKLAALKGE